MPLLLVLYSQDQVTRHLLPVPCVHICVICVTCCVTVSVCQYVSYVTTNLTRGPVILSDEARFVVIADQ